MVLRLNRGLLGYQLKSHIEILDNNSSIYKSNPTPINMNHFENESKNKFLWTWPFYPK